MRIFIAVDFPENIKKEIARIQEKLPEFQGKITEKENLHLTLKFLGETDEKALGEVKKRLSEIRLKSFEAEISSIGYFSEKFLRIIWLGISGCNELQKQIDNKLEGLFGKEERFMGHLTIARIKNVKGKQKFIEELKKIKVPSMKFRINAFCLKQSVLTSEKPLYKNLGVYSLK